MFGNFNDGRLATVRIQCLTHPIHEILTCCHSHPPISFLLNCQSVDALFNRATYVVEHGLVGRFVVEEFAGPMFDGFDGAGKPRVGDGFYVDALGWILSQQALFAFPVSRGIVRFNCQERETKKWPIF
jgi:hypothetical protein